MNAKSLHVLKVLGAVPAHTSSEPDEPQPESRGFDGGARTPVPPRPETHSETLTRILLERGADAGRWFGS
jgi:hypothetical protein